MFRNAKESVTSLLPRMCRRRTTPASTQKYILFENCSINTPLIDLLIRLTGTVHQFVVRPKHMLTHR